MNKAYGTVTLWLFWCSIATVIYLSLYVDTDVLSFLSNDKSRITWIIIALFLVGVITSFLLAIKLTGEKLEAARQEQFAQEQGLMGIVAAERKKKVVNRFFAAVKVITASNSSPNFESLVEIEFGTYLRVNHGIEVLGNLLITLGLIGTVVGLTFTLTGLTGSLNALGQDQDLLMAGLRKAMGGMGTAFYTTLLGSVLGGVLMRIFALIAENGIGSLQEHVLKICMVHCAADFKPGVERDVRFLNVEVDALEDKVQALNLAFRESRAAMQEFRGEIKALYEISGADDGVYTLRETLRMQKYYRALLRQEFQLMNTLNHTWWQRFKGFLRIKQDQ
ncbi:MAG: MotA/TolQ/ExbB proton channel family protein [Gammaproteobacteria bacterium]|nr:MotA/TolQ/ExbB proton channel family protein [Gammaproteobacteria bacterium]